MLMQALMSQPCPCKRALISSCRFCLQQLISSIAWSRSLTPATVLLLAACSSSGVDTGSSSSSGLSAPGGVAVSFVDATSLEISWSSVSGASEYHVFRDVNADASLRSRVAIVNSTSYTDTNNGNGLVTSSDYWYWVRACTSSSNCSGFSSSAKGNTTPDSLAPSDFSAVAGTKSITLSWSQNSAYTYNLLRSTNDCFGSDADDFADYSTLCDNQLFQTNVDSPVEHKNLDHESTYYYWLEVIDEFANKSYASTSATPNENTTYQPGEIMWQETLGTDKLSLAPALDSGRRALYVAYNNKLYAFNIDSGKEIWDSPFTVVDDIGADPIVDRDGFIYVTAANSDSESVVYRINPDDGSQAWVSTGASNSTPDKISGGGVALAQTDESGVFYFANDESYIYAINNLATGAVSIYTYLNNEEVSGPISIDIYGSLYTGTTNNNLVIKPESNEVADFTHVGKQIVGSIALSQDASAFFGSGQQAYGYDSQGNLIWSSGTLSGAQEITASAVLAPDNSSIYIPSYTRLHALSIDRGEQIWSYDFSNSTIGSTAPVIDTNGYIYLGDREGNISIVDGQGEFVAQYSTSSSSAISTPMALDDTASILYFGAGQKVYAMQAYGRLNRGSQWAKYRGNVRNTGYITDSASLEDDVAYAQQELDNTDLAFAGEWVNDTISSGAEGSGISSMRSPSDLSHNSEACISTQVQQAGNLSFYWKVSSEATFDILKLTITNNGEVVDKAYIDGEQDWVLYPDNANGEILVYANSTIEWCYSKDSDGSEGSDAGWLDRVVFDIL